MTVTLSGADKVPASKDYYHLGDHEWPITTQSADAQIWFNRGVIWAYAFNHDEAAACFEQVVAHDPECAMGYWGAAYSYGPNYNKQWGAFHPTDLVASVKKCYDLSQLAKKHTDGATPLEQAFVDAIQHRYPAREVPESFDASIEAYAKAMREVYRRFGRDHLDVTALAADAMMNTSPWKLFDTHTREPILTTHVHEVKDILERGLKLPGANRHPGLLHLYIHLMEMSKTPEVTIHVADHLRNLVPDGGHLQHMPSHIDVLLGDYRLAIEANIKATAADDKYFARESPTIFYSFYRLHNLHSLIYAGMLAGREVVVLETVDRMEKAIPEELLRVESPPMADLTETFMAVRVHALIRFGRWDDLKALEVPKDAKLYCVTTAARHYGKAIAYAATGEIERAEEERELFRAAAARVPESRLDYPNPSRNTLKVAAAMLDGELEYRRGNFERAFSHLRTAVERDDALMYGEPWSWMIPTRHAYAALLLERGRVEEAAGLYAEDLGFVEGRVRAQQHPGNVWALCGYHECLVRLGRAGEAAIIGKQLLSARAGADVEIRSSCYCRLGGVEEEEGVAGCCGSERDTEGGDGLQPALKDV
ncbi:related to TPR domain protein [Cephalotrichum gorgonifer]|uniref:Related to TPR domain protein n=1 Tax=Cephalotrichum gorgonifer TaxID=2041049 RepID=A0AAE8T0I7_9PEZI|nr:related to TPR domain protein [Cephalotrichum gorgonifer]